MARIAFFSIYAFGHTNPTLAVVGELTRRGHRVRYYSFTPFQKAIKAAGGEFVRCDAYLPPPPPDVDRQVGRDFAGLVEMITDTTLAMDGPIGRDLREFALHCVVSDSLCFWGKLWSAKLGLPYVCSTTTFAFNRETAGMMKQTPGLRLRRASPEAIRAAVRQVRERRSYRSRAREIAAGFRDAGGYRRGADKILEATARGGGACAENPPML